MRQKELKSYSALKWGLLIVAASYFLFNLHSLFTLGWVGEWDRFGGGFTLSVFIQDITNFVGIIIRFIGRYHCNRRRIVLLQKRVPVPTENLLYS